METRTQILKRSLQPSKRVFHRTAPSDFLRFLIANTATGIVIGALFIATVLMSDAGGIATLISASTTSLLTATLFIAKGIVLSVGIVILVAMLAANRRRGY